MSASDRNHEGEPKTPMWLPALGAVLFLVAALVWGFRSPARENLQNAGTASPAAAADAGAPARTR